MHKGSDEPYPDSPISLRAIPHMPMAPNVYDGFAERKRYAEAEDAGIPRMTPEERKKRARQMDEEE